MKTKIGFIAGFLAGAVLFGAVGVFAADVVAKLSDKKIFADGNKSNAVVYDIGGADYFKLSDMAKIGGFTTSYDAKENALTIDTRQVFYFGDLWFRPVLDNYAPTKNEECNLTVETNSKKELKCVANVRFKTTGTDYNGFTNKPIAIKTSHATPDYRAFVVVEITDGEKVYEVWTSFKPPKK